MKLTFQLPIPDRCLFSNGSRGAEFLRRKAKKAAREIAKTEAERVLNDASVAPPKWTKARYWVTLFHLPGPVRDPDNLMASLKAYIDGIADAKVIKNDRSLWPERPVYQRVTRMPRIEITIEEDA